LLDVGISGMHIIDIIATVGRFWLESIVLWLETHGEETKSIESILNLVAIAHSRVGALLLLAHDAAHAIVANEFWNGRILQLALVLRVVLRVRLVIVVILLFNFSRFTVAVRNVVIALLESLSLTVTSAQLSLLLDFAIGEHHHVPLEFTILLNRLQKLKKRQIQIKTLMTNYQLKIVVVYLLCWGHSQAWGKHWPIRTPWLRPDRERPSMV